MRVAAGAVLGFAAGLASAALIRRHVGALVWWIFTTDQR